MTPLAVQIDTTEVRRLMRGIPDEMPFAVSLGLTWTAKFAARQLADTMGQHFTLRTPELPKRIGYLMTRRGSQEVIVGSKSWYMALQAEGGERGDKNGHGVWIPVGARKNKGTITRPGRWPGKMDDPGSGGTGYTADVFSGKVKTAKGWRLGTWQRVWRLTSQKESGRIINKMAWSPGMKGAMDSNRRGLKLLYWQHESVQIKARWPLQRIVEMAVAKRWPHYSLLAVEWVFRNPNSKAARPPLVLGWMTSDAFNLSLAEAQAR